LPVRATSLDEGHDHRPVKDEASEMCIAAKRTNRMFALRVILLGASLVTAFSLVHAQAKTGQKSAARHSSAASGKETFFKHCASCDGEGGRGNGPAAIAMKDPPPDLTTLSRRHEGKYPAGYVSAVVKFGRSLAAHGSEDMPVWGARFKTLDPAGDP